MRHSTLFLALTAVLVAGCETPTTPAIRSSADVIAASAPTTFSGEATVVQVQVTPIGAPAPVGINLVETGKLPESGGALNATLLQLSISKEQTGGLISLGAEVGYSVYFIGSGSGQTVGMRVLGIRAIDSATGGRVDYGKAFVRYLVSIVSFLAILIGYLWMLWDPEKQTWHDKVAGTFVVPVSDYPVEAWPG